MDGGRSDGEREVRRGQDRATTVGEGTTTWHALAHGAHHDPGNTSFGPLVLHDEHLLDPGAGFPEHPHRGLEVVSWLLAGELLHEDATGGRARVGPGAVQVLSCGTGVRHSEHAGAAGTRFVQAWLLADEPLGPPRHDVHDAGPTLAAGGLVPVAGPGAPLALACAGAGLSVGRLAPGGEVVVPAAPLVHLHVGGGGLEAPVRLGEGDALRLRGAADVRVVAGERGAELLVWSLPAPPPR